MMLIRWSMLSFVTVSLGACSSITGGCKAYLSPGIAVSIVDAKTGLSVASTATVQFVDGAYTESKTVGPGNQNDAEKVFGAADRAGTYTVRVSKAGYIPWVQESVRVVTDDCGHAATVSLKAQLVAVP